MTTQENKAGNFPWGDYLEKPDLVKHAYLVDNEWIEGGTEAKFDVTNPATHELLSQLPNCGTDETNRAVESADLAFKTWSKTLAAYRGEILRKWGEKMLEHKKDLATIMTLEQGKPLKEAEGEVAYAASFFEWFAGEGKRAYGEVIPSHKQDARIVVKKEPVGVAGIITPWNFPLAMLTRKIGPALAAGCTCVIKPAETTPLSAIAMISLGLELGLPKGVINLVFGDYVKIGKEITSNDKVKKISFTGSTGVGKFLIKESAHQVKRLSLELGGNAPFIVFDDADLDKSVAALIACKFRNGGQTCVCANRVYIQEGIYDKLVSLLKQEVEKMKVGNGLEAGVAQGPLVNKASFEKVEQHVNDAVAKGAKVISGGKRAENALPGYFFEPTILTDVGQDCLVNREETFGPLAAIVKFKSEDEVIKMSNNTEYGLSGYFCTQNLSRAWRVAEALEVGMVGINEGIIATAAIPFGGVKESGLGREGSRYGIEEYLNIKYILMGI